MNLIKSKKGILSIASVMALFLVFAGVTFVQSQEVKTDAANATAVRADAACPASKGTMTAGASGMPGSCSELHAQALAADEMTQPQYDAATAMLASVTQTGGMTAEQCKEAMAKLGYECNATDLKACAERLQALGFCKGMSADECAAQLAKGLCTSSDPATCAEAKKAGACCAAMTKSADAGTAEVKPAVAKTTETQKPKQCDLRTGKCSPDAQSGSGD